MVTHSTPYRTLVLPPPPHSDPYSTPCFTHTVRPCPQTSGHVSEHYATRMFVNRLPWQQILGTAPSRACYRLAFQLLPPLLSPLLLLLRCCWCWLLIDSPSANVRRIPSRRCLVADLDQHTTLVYIPASIRGRDGDEGTGEQSNNSVFPVSQRSCCCW